MKNTEKYVLLHTTKVTYRSNIKTEYISYCTYDNAVDYIIEHEDLFYSNRNEKGQFCKKYYTDCSGNIIAEYGDFKFDIDGWYNMYQIMKIAELDINDWLDVFETEIPYSLLGEIDNVTLEQIELELRDTPFHDNITEFIEENQKY